MKAEERAKVVLDFLARECWFDACAEACCENCGCAAHITAAIRSAENEALERAAQVVRDNLTEDLAHYPVLAISALKHKEP